MSLLWVVILSCLIQLAAAVLALRLMSITKMRLAWGLLSSALFLMAFRRLISIYQILILHHPQIALDGVEEYVGLALSVCMLLAIILIKPLFSEIKKSEEAAKESRQMFKIFSDYTYDWEYWISPDGSFVHISPSCERFTGYSPEEFYKTPELLTDIVHPEDRDFVTDHLKNLQPDKYHSADFRIVAKTGEVRWFAHVCQPVFSDDGKWLGRRGSNRDVTARKRAEEKQAKSYDQLQATLAGTVKALSAVGEHRDPYTAGHQERVAELACAISAEMGLPQQVCDDIRVAARLHDIGKVEIPAEILSKPGKLTDLEFSMVKTHPVAGANILEAAQLSDQITKMVLEHHERLDGSGYPSGLATDKICIEARIMAVADVVEAMILHRPYRSALGLDKALEEIEKNRGILYDPDVVDACLKLFREKNFKFSNGTAAST